MDLQGRPREDTIIPPTAAKPPEKAGLPGDTTTTRPTTGA